VNSCFPRMARSFTEWQYRGTMKRKGAGLGALSKYERTGSDLREHIPTRTSAKEGKNASISAPRPSETERKGQRGCT
jgi:hypothetical protein